MSRSVNVPQRHTSRPGPPTLTHQRRTHEDPTTRSAAAHRCRYHPRQPYAKTRQHSSASPGAAATRQRVPDKRGAEKSLSTSALRRPPISCGCLSDMVTSRLVYSRVGGGEGVIMSRGRDRRAGSGRGRVGVPPPRKPPVINGSITIKGQRLQSELQSPGRIDTSSHHRAAERAKCPLPAAGESPPPPLGQCAPRVGRGRVANLAEWCRPLTGAQTVRVRLSGLRCERRDQRVGCQR